MLTLHKRANGEIQSIIAKRFMDISKVNTDHSNDTFGPDSHKIEDFSDPELLKSILETK
jgi:hypothetical protein